MMQCSACIDYLKTHGEHIICDDCIDLMEMEEE